MAVNWCFMELKVIDHPLVQHKLAVLRDEDTPSSVFRELADELVTLLAYEATREVRVKPKAINTPVAPTTGLVLAEPRPILIPILRAGLGMLSGMTRLLPTAEVGFLGMRRDEETLAIETYANRLPEDLTDRQVFLVDPMLATGGTLVAAINYALERGASDVTCICLVAAPEGVAAVKENLQDRTQVKIVVAALDDGLTPSAYITPGLGDAGDRLYGIVDH